MKDDRIKDAFERIARRDVPDDLNLWPSIAVRLDRRNALLHSYRTRPLTLVLIVVLILLMLTGIAYAIGNLLGFIPGVGIIDQGVPLRILDNSTTETRDGITITVERAVLSGDKTVVIYSVEGIPSNAYPEREEFPGCTKVPEIHLQDGATLKFSSGESASWGTGYESKAIYASIATGVNSATFIIPCIYGTLPGTLPENWKLQLQFIPAPPDLTVMPVIEVSPSPHVSGSPPTSQPLVLERVVETQDGYILTGKIQMAGLPADMTMLDSISRFRITDATGRELITKIPDDVDVASNKAGEIAWAYEIIGKQQSWPLTITVDAINVSLTHGDQFWFNFDTGTIPQTGQGWMLNKDMVLNGHHVTLSSVHRLTDGYKFTLKADPQVTGISIRIDGFHAAGGGGGSDGKGNFSLSNVYEGNVPSGELTLVISLQSVFVTVPWSITWQPDELPTAVPDNTPSSPSTVCVAGDTLSKLTPLPANLNGKVLLYGRLDGANWGVNLVSLDGGQKQLVTHQGNWATLSPDGTRVVYSGTDERLHVKDLGIGEDRILDGASGYDLHMSPDGQFVATVDSGSLSLIDIDRSNTRSIPINAVTFALAGWSADGTKVYITTPGARGFILQTVDILTGEVKDLFVLEDSSRKEPFAAVSPDGNWIAYRGRENNSLYLVRTNGAEGRLVIDRTLWTISSIVWSLDSKRLGISLADFGTEKRTVLILQPESCETFILPNLQGEIQGLILP
jgi:hypothetical protein